MEAPKERVVAAHAPAKAKKRSDPYRAPPAAHHEAHGIAHVSPLPLLFGILGALLVLTVVTVAVTKIDLGGQGNLIVAMVIATIKAGLVVTYFMHLRWDRAFNVMVFLSSVLFMILFISLALTDRKEYQNAIDTLEQTQSVTTP